jgi:hypothetical protein
MPRRTPSVLLSLGKSKEPDCCARSRDHRREGEKSISAVDTLAAANRRM